MSLAYTTQQTPLHRDETKNVIKLPRARREYTKIVSCFFFSTLYTRDLTCSRTWTQYIYRFIYIICIYLCTEETLNYKQTSFFVFSAKLLRYISGEKGTQDVHVRLKKNITKGEREMTEFSLASEGQLTRPPRQ